MNFNEAWGRVSEFERGKDHLDEAGMGLDLEKNTKEIKRTEENQSEDIFLLMKKQAKKDETAKELFDDILNKSLHYIDTVDDHTESVIKKQAGEELENSGKSRTRAHDALIDSINIYSRYCKKVHIDNSWRTVLGLDRTQITKWALNIAHLVRTELLKK